MSEAEAAEGPKTIIYRGGVLLFDLPHDWIERYEEDDGGIFYRNKKDSGTLRVNVTTCSIPLPASRNMIIDVLKESMKKFPKSRFAEENGKPILVYDEIFWEKWQMCFARYWRVGNFIPPNFGQIALFSYTVLKSRLNTSEVQSDLKILENSIRFLRFSTAISNSTDGMPPKLPLN